MGASLRDGIYNIRFVPNGVEIPFTGGLYATSAPLNAQIRAEALNPSATGDQKWLVQAVSGKTNTYTIVCLAVTVGAGNMVHGFGVGQHTSHGTPVVLTDDIAQWKLILVDVENKIFQIQESHKEGMVGASSAVTEENYLLVVKSYPVIRDMHPLPRWQFIPT